MFTVLIMSAKLTTLALLKIETFWNKCYDLFFVHDVTNKILSRDSNHVVVTVMWPKFGHSSISMREVIVTTVLQGFDQKKNFSWEMVLVQVQ